MIENSIGEYAGALETAESKVSGVQWFMGALVEKLHEGGALTEQQVLELFDNLRHFHETLTLEVKDD